MYRQFGTKPDGGRLVAESGRQQVRCRQRGHEPKGLHPRTIEVMKEIGIDVSRQTSKDVKQFLQEKFDYVITVCDRAKQHCPVFPSAEPIHWGFDDPADAPMEKQLEAFRRVRNEIQQRLRLFLLSNQE